MASSRSLRQSEAKSHEEQVVILFIDEELDHLPLGLSGLA